jgi:glycosyltransferase involved in cell wall biosynthesis
LAVLLAAPDGEASNIIDRHGCGVSVAAEDPDALADACRTLMDDGDGLKALADKSLAAARHHSREVQADHMAAVLELAAARRENEASSVKAGKG